MKALVTGAGALLGQGIIHSLRKMSRKCHIIAVDPSGLSAGLYWADEKYIIPMASDPAYNHKLNSLLEKTRPDIVFVGTDVELTYFAQNKTRIEKQFQTKVVVSSPQVVEIANDKYLTFEFLKKNSFPAPESCLPQDLNEFLERTTFPYIVKPRFGARSIGVSKVENHQELINAISVVDRPVIQEYLPASVGEFTAGCIVFNGRVAGSIVMKRDLRDGNTYRAYSDTYSDLNKQVILLGEALNPYGPANFQFRVNKNGEAVVFEINGRFSGTTPLRSLVGFNEVEFVVEHELFDRSEFDYKVEKRIILRHWSETVITENEMAQLH